MQSRLPLFKCLFYYCIISCITTTAFATADTIITYKSSDGLLITADTYLEYPANKVPLILLFHQAGSSRGEYTEIAPELNRLGFNCIAVDLRSGEYSRGKDNETAIRAGKADLGTSYTDALPDIIASVQYAYKQYDTRVIIWGSSYSASLVLKVAGEYPEYIKGVIAFSPGEYFSHLGKSKTWIRDAAQKIMVPTFVTSSKNEANDWSAIYNAIKSHDKQSFVPETQGKHGSRALWKKYNDSDAYWNAVTKFLNKLK